MVLSITLSFVNARVPQINHYLTLHQLSKNCTSVELNVERDFLLSDFYNNMAVATKVIHADSILIDGICNEIDIHVVTNEFKVCKRKYPYNHYKRKTCIWNKNNVIQSAKIATAGAYAGDSVRVQLYDKKECEKLTYSGTLTVKNIKYTPSPSPKTHLISNCLRITAVKNSGGKRILFNMNIWKVLQQHYEGRNQKCGRFVFVESVSVNGVCGSFNAHVFKPKDYEKCQHLKGVAFKKCFWTASLMKKYMFLDSVSAFKGEEVKVKTFRKRRCEEEWDSGMVIVQ